MIKKCKKPKIILARPQLGENIGMSARAMGNFNLDDLSLVSPRDCWPNSAAEASAAHAIEIIKNTKIYNRLEDAISDSHYVYAMSSRKRSLNKNILNIKEAAAKITNQIAAGIRVAIVFGCESSGLDNDEIANCDEIITITTNPNIPSLNLAASVLLLAYELDNNKLVAKDSINQDKNGLLEQGFLPELDKKSSNRIDFTIFFDYLIDELRKGGFFTNPAKEVLMIRKLKTLLLKYNLNDAEINIFCGIINAIKNTRMGSHKQ